MEARKVGCLQLHILLVSISHNDAPVMFIIYNTGLQDGQVLSEMFRDMFLIY